MANASRRPTSTVSHRTGRSFGFRTPQTRYAARGGQLVPVSTADITLDQVGGSISGTGFTPNSPITLGRVYSPGGDDNTETDWQTDATENFTIGVDRRRSARPDADACTSGLEGLECPFGPPLLERSFFA